MVGGAGVLGESKSGRGIEEGENVVPEAHAVAGGLEVTHAAERGAETAFPALRPHRLEVHRVLRRSLAEELALRRRAERLAVGGEEVGAGRELPGGPELGADPVEAHVGRLGTPVRAGVHDAEQVVW